MAPADTAPAAGDAAASPVAVGASGSARGRTDRWAASLTSGTRRTVAILRETSSPLCLGLTLAGIVLYTGIFATLSIRNYHNYGNWAFDLAIYDQAFWLVSRFGDTFMSVRGMDVWGHHVTLVALVFAPFYRLGAGPEFLFVVQSFGIALGALPVYLIAKARLGKPSIGLLFAAVYLMYAPLQNINQRDFHPEALVIAPFLFAWYCAMQRRWRWFFVCLVIAMGMREDTALAVIMLGIVLGVANWRKDDGQRVAKMALATVVLGIAWYAVSTQLIIPHFNDGDSAFYLKMFYGRWGGSFSGIVENIVRHPNRVISDAVQHDRLTFYKQLAWPVGWLPLLAPLHLLMAAPQLLASVIGDSPYARQIWFQYTSVMIAPIFIASIEGAANLRSIARRVAAALGAGPSTAVVLKVLAVCGLLGSSYATNVAWSSSPISDRYSGIWFQDNPRRDAFDAALAMIPSDAVVSSSYNFGPHLAHRRGSYDFPNPFWPAYWGNELPTQADCTNFPSASEVDYIVLDYAYYENDAATTAFLAAIIAPEGDFELLDEDLLTESKIFVARRVEPGPDGVALEPNCTTEVPRPAAGLGTAAGMLANYPHAAIGATLPGMAPTATVPPATPSSSATSPGAQTVATTTPVG
ncbi:DUF2079 domain-containing protein [Desertimonas flava]|uniref:DUF2079 domain-containing protein n=1 Tax=Desertimonas flava TaxID=2064846 RepID=UPI000E3572E2|nr:DUF2079 domain-containing protein [Desertimonas flava]